MPSRFDPSDFRFADALDMTPPRQPQPVDEGIAMLVAALADPAIVVAPDTSVVTANAGALRLFPTLRLGEALLFGLRDPDIVASIETVRREGRAAEAEFLRRVPEERTFRVHLAALPTQDVLLVFQDMSERRKIERMRADFVANASHELRTPLAAVLGFIETLEGPARDDAPARARFLALMREQAKRMTRLVDDLLSLSRLETRVAPPPPIPVDLASLVREVLDTLSVLARDHDVTFVFQPPSQPLTVQGERDDLFRVVENLVENAIRYGREGGTVTITLAASAVPGRASGSAGGGDGVVLEVADEGPGIPPEHLPRLTERFYRVDNAQSRARGGTGLGLSIVKHIVGRHEGRLEIESVPGQGARFRVRLPARLA